MSSVRLRSFRRWTRANTEEGASLVEFALILPILAMLLLGIVTGGLVLNSKNSLNNAARESARYGATLPVTDMNVYLNDVANVAIESATGDLDLGVPGRYVCVAYVYGPPGEGALDQTTSLTIGSGGPPSNVPCFADGRPNTERRIQVQVRRTSDFYALVFARTVTLDEQSVARYERKQ